MVPMLVVPGPLGRLDRGEVLRS